MKGLNGSSRIRIDEFEVDLCAGELRKNDGVVIQLPEQALQVLRMLVAAEGEIVTRDQIQQKLWSTDTVVDFPKGINTVMTKLRRAFGDSGDEPKYIKTISKRGYRLRVPVEGLDSQARPPVVDQPAAAEERTPWPPVEPALPSAAPAQRATTRWRRLAAVLTAICLTIAGAAGYLVWQPRPKLTNRDPVVLGDFENTTGEPIFDDALKQGLAMQLSQSPFLDLIGDRKIDETLSEMGRHPGDHLTPDMTREMCLRTNSKVMINGAIGRLGDEFVVGLKAVDCNNGRVVATSFARADHKDAVLGALDTASSELRTALGESLGSVQRYSAPLEQATTPSLAALKAFSLGRKKAVSEGADASIPLLNEAVRIDPNFAAAYMHLSDSYADLGQPEEAEKCIRRAYDLREKVSHRERLEIEADYYLTTGELEKAADAYAEIRRLYNRPAAYGQGGYIASTLGDFDDGLKLFLEQRRLTGNPSDDINTVAVYLALNRFDEASAAAKETEDHKLENQSILVNRYILAFLTNNTGEMQHILQTAETVPGNDGILLMTESDTAAWYGKRNAAHSFTYRAADAAQRRGAKEEAAGYLIEAALREAEWGNVQAARSDVTAALKLSPTTSIQQVSALVLARIGELAEAEAQAAQLNQKHPQDTLIQKYWLPTIAAAIALHRQDPVKAIDSLKIASSVEFGLPSVGPIVLCPVYLRGEAYLMLHDGRAAAKEFQKFIDHRGLVGNFPFGALARLGLARSYAVEGPSAREEARSTYQNFLNLWKDADPDIPIYQQAKLEFARLQ